MESFESTHYPSERKLYQHEPNEKLDTKNVKSSISKFLKF